jgi:hypothetical protein
LLSINFAVLPGMFLTSPSIAELQKLDMSLLLDMLVYHTSLHFKLLKTEGASITTQACKEFIINLQTAIEMKKKSENSAKDNSSDPAFSQAIPL